MDHAKVIAVCMALCAFAVSTVAGIAVNNEFDLILTRAILALGACYVIGYIIGAAGQYTFSQRVEELQRIASAGSERGANNQQSTIRTS